MIKTLELILLLMILFLMNEVAKADSHTLGLVGGTYAQDPRGIAGLELNYTYEKQGLIYNAAAFELERGKTSFSSGVGYQTEVSQDLYLGGMGAILFKRYDRQPKAPSQSFEMENFIPLTHFVTFMPWFTVQKNYKLNDEWSVSTQLYVNHLAVHLSIGFSFKNFELGE
jgi:hypothetical protein